MTDGEVIARADELLTFDICEELECDLALHPERLSEREREAGELLGVLYRLIHGNNRLNSCYSVHEGWRQEFPGTAAEGRT